MAHVVPDAADTRTLEGGDGMEGGRHGPTDSAQRTARGWIGWWPPVHWRAAWVPYTPHTGYAPTPQVAAVGVEV
eukprot:6214032-Pleurochrysis_carterae.AAC.2